MVRTPDICFVAQLSIVHPVDRKAAREDQRDFPSPTATILTITKATGNFVSSPDDDNDYAGHAGDDGDKK